jgi:hypothetical protein
MTSQRARIVRSPEGFVAFFEGENIGTWNSHGAALAGLEVEGRRRAALDAYPIGQCVGWKTSDHRGLVTAPPSGGTRITRAGQVYVRWDDGAEGWYPVTDCPMAAQSDREGV